MELSGISRQTCAYCRGDGKIGCMPCPACEGKGFVMVSLPVARCECCDGTGIAGCCRCATCLGSGFKNIIRDNNRDLESMNNK